MAYNTGHEVGSFCFSYYADFSDFKLHIVVDEEQRAYF